MSVGEYLVRGNLVAARVLNVLNPQQDHYRDTVTAEVSDRGLEIIVAEARGPFHPDTAAVMRQANVAAQAAFDAAMLPVGQRRQQIGHFLGLIEQVMTGPADQTAYDQIQQHLKGLRGVGVVDVSINYAAVRADNTRLRQEAQQLVGQGEQAADLVVQYLDEALRAETANGRGAFGRFPAFGVERGVRDFFFIHNLLKGEGWGHVMTESGLLLGEGGKHLEALNELLVARNYLGYDTPTVKLGLGRAYEGLGDADAAIKLFYEVVKAAPLDADATASLAELHRQKADQIAREVEPLHPGIADLEAAVQTIINPKKVLASGKTAQEKASALYTAGVAHLTLRDGFPNVGLELLQKSWELDPDRSETHDWLGEAYGRNATPAARLTLAQQFVVNAYGLLSGAGARN
ncbi:hypothetical protein HYY73_01860 [Candidatus Woesearchaeota archaeon]|nr:hypothetical protein [Candidatus Woesearchaeota archaeon]